MQDLFKSKFTIKIDTSQCTSLISGYDKNTNDTWYYCDQIFESGKIYGLVSEEGQGCTYLAYLLGGKIEFKNLKVLYNDKPLSQKDLFIASWNLEPFSEKYGNLAVKKEIEKALSYHPEKGTFQAIAELISLTPERYDRKIKALGGGRWKAAAAYGYVHDKKIFYSSYHPSSFYYAMCQTGLLNILRKLTDEGAIVLLPVGSDVFIKHIEDEVIYIDRKYDIEGLRKTYKTYFKSSNNSWIQ